MSDKKLNILITAASRRVALIRGFVEALEKLGNEGKVVTTDVNPLSPGLYMGHDFHYAPLTTDPGYISRLREICSLEKIDVIIPTIDDELVLMGETKEEFARMGINILISPAQTSRICNDKILTYRFFSENDIPTPRTWLPSELPPVAQLKFPLFLKPRMGRGSVGIHKLNNPRELEFFLGYVKDPIVQEYLEGKEYTLDTLTDFSGQPLSVVPRQRLWVRSGVMDKGRTENNPMLIEMGVKVATTLKAVGPINTQVKFHKGKPYVFEVNPRFSGGIPLTIAAGGDFPLWISQMALGQKLEPRLGEFEDGLVMMSYEANVFKKIGSSDMDDIVNKLI